ncbi:MAG: class I SAM-dependent methyltransferase [Proteobacteria bacterium]|nr:class I SAM-dependent methyltransferase [Pseudomonadota bacterium]
MEENHDKWWDKWDKAAAGFDFINGGVELRFGEEKAEWFSQATGTTLLVAIGTGLDIPYFKDDQHIIGLDISMKMLEKARAKEVGHKRVDLVRADVQELGFADNSIDTVVTSCTFCSVPDPVLGLKELRRVLKPGGRLLMFEHVRSDIFWMGPMMDLLTKVSRRFGPDLNRRTKENVLKAGFKLTREVNLYLDMVKLFEAIKEI